MPERRSWSAIRCRTGRTFDLLRGAVRCAENSDDAYAYLRATNAGATPDDVLAQDTSHRPMHYMDAETMRYPRIPILADHRLERAVDVSARRCPHE